MNHEVPDDQDPPDSARRRPAELIKIRVPRSLLDSLEEYLENLRTQPPFIRMSRAEAVRWLIALGLERENAPLAPEGEAREPDAP